MSCLLLWAAPGLASAAAPGRASAAARPGRLAAATSLLCHSKRHPKAASRISYGIRAVLSHRQSLVAVRVSDPHRGVSCGLRVHRHFDSASVVKATILAALMHKAHAHHRKLTSRERNLAWLMITQSDNNAATALWNDVGMHALQRFLDLAGMKETELGLDGYWGETRITAHDEMILLHHLLNPNRVLTESERDYELRLMAHVIPSQRWGVTAGVPSIFTIHVKNGWAPIPLYGPWWINSIGCFTYRSRSYSIVVLTYRNPDMAYGVTTVQDVAEVINRNLNRGAAPVVPPSRPFPSWGIPDEHIPPRVPGR